MPVVLAALQEGSTVGAVVRLVVEFAGRTFPGHAVALDIAQVILRTAGAFAFHPDKTGLDDDAALAERGIAVASAEDAARAGTASALVPLELAFAALGTAARKRERADHAVDVTPAALGAGRADFAEARLEVVIVVHRELVRVNARARGQRRVECVWGLRTMRLSLLSDVQTNRIRDTVSKSFILASLWFCGLPFPCSDS